MECVNCKTGISARASDPICVDCRFDPNVMISLTEAKLKYKLTEEELENGNLFQINFICHKNYSTKFLRSEINDLAKVLTKDLDNSNKKKRAFNKQNDIFMVIDNKKNIKMERMKNINNICLELLVKHSVIQTPEITEFMTTLINEDDTDFDEFQIALKIVDNVNILYKKILYKQERKKKLDDMIENHFTNKYLELGYEHNAYVYFDKNDTLPEFTFNIIKSDIDRIKNLDDLINSNIGKKYIDFAYSHKTYFECTYSKNITSDVAFSIIIKDINRKKELDVLITNNIEKKYMDLAFKHYLYNNYIRDKKLKVDNVFETIKNSVDKEINKDNREKELKSALRKKKIKLQNGASTKAYFEYIQQNINNLDDAILNIVNELERQKRKNDIDVIIMKKISENQYDIKSQIFYKDYLDGKLTLEKAIDIFDNYILQIKNKEIEYKRTSDLKNVIGVMDNCWRDKYLNLAICKQYIEHGTVSIFVVKNEINLYRQKLLAEYLADEKWIKWKILADRHFNMKNDRNILLDVELFNFCDSDKTEHKIKKNNSDRKYMHTRCEQLGLMHYTETIICDEIFVMEKPNEWLLKFPK